MLDDDARKNDKKAPSVTARSMIIRLEVKRAKREALTDRPAAKPLNKRRAGRGVVAAPWGRA